MNIRPHLFAIGSTNVAICSIDDKYDIKVEVNCQAPEEGGEFCSFNWNEKVSHILATATNTGMTYIYDMKKCYIFLSILDQTFLSEEDQHSGPMNTCVVWGSDGAQVIIAYDASDFNYLTQYHMKQPKAPTAMYQNGHSTSIINIVKNARDSNFLLSLGRDNIVTCWSIKTKKPLARVQLKEKCSQVIWANKIADCFICAGFDGNLYFDRINFTEDVNGFAEGNELIPKWLNKPAGVTFSFGGKMFKYSHDKPSLILSYKISGNKALVDNIQKFLEKVEKPDLNELLSEKIESTENDKNPNVSLFWAALKSIYGNNLDELFTKMGFDKKAIGDEILSALGKTKKRNNEIKLYTPQEESKEDLNELFEKPIETVEETVKQNAQTKQEILEQPNTIKETYSRNINWNVGQEKLIKQCLLIGDLESAVEILFKNNRSSEALLIASLKPELFNSAKETYFNSNKDLFVKSIFPAIIGNNFDLLFDFNVIKEWKEYLLYSKTYLGNSEEFIKFADKLGDKLSTSPDIYAPLVCYVLAGKYDKCIDLLTTFYQREFEKSSRDDRKFLLHNLFEQLLTINKVLNQNPITANEKYNKILGDYCLLLIDEGLNLQASKYLISVCNNDAKMMELYDRIYYNCESQLQSLPKPINPYQQIHIRAKNVQPQKQRGDFGVNKPMRQPIMEAQTKPRNEPQNRFKPPMMRQKETPAVPFKETQNPKAPFHPVTPPPVEKVVPKPQEVKHQAPGINFGGEKRGFPIKPPAFKPVNPPIRTVPHANEPVTTQPPMRQKEQPPKFMNNPPMKAREQATPFGNQPVPQTKSETHSNHSVSMSQEEEIIYAYFEKIVDVYSSVYPDENKQKDFKTKINVLLNKLQLHEIKPNLLKLLNDFMGLNDKADIQGLKRLYMRIQSCDWDKNKSWMPLLERLINMKR